MRPLFSTLLSKQASIWLRQTALTKASKQFTHRFSLVSNQILPKNCWLILGLIGRRQVLEPRAHAPPGQFSMEESWFPIEESWFYNKNRARATLFGRSTNGIWNSVSLIFENHQTPFHVFNQVECLCIQNDGFCINEMMINEMMINEMMILKNDDQ